MSPRSSTILTLTMLMLAVGTLTTGEAYSGEKKSKVEMAATAKVTIDEAIKIASEKVSGKVIEAELEKKHDKLVWEVEVVTTENKVMEVHIDAETGAVIDVEEEKAKPKKSHKRS
jgi:uncharacterized membrane protein YkoI